MRAPLNVNLSRVTLLLIGLALSAGVLAAWFAQNYVNDEIAARRASLEAKYEPRRVIVALGDLPTGTRLDASTVAAREVPAEFLHRDAIRAEEWAQVQGRATRHASHGGRTRAAITPARTQGRPIFGPHRGRRTSADHPR